MLKIRLDEQIHHEEDQVLIVDLGPAHDKGLERIDALGRAFHTRPSGAYIIA